MLEPSAQEVFIKYRNALLAIGVDFSDELVTDLIEYYERVTGVKIQQHPNRIILQKPPAKQGENC